MPATRRSGEDVFATTHWSVVQIAARCETTRAQDALSQLCASYWYPVYAYVRRHGASPEDAQDLTQEFFARLLSKNFLAGLSPSNGKFRSFLTACLKNFLANERDRARAAKRDHARLVSFDQHEAEERYRLEPTHDITPEKLFERRWAMTLLDGALSKLASEYQREGKGELFEKLRPALTGTRETQPYAELARETGMTEGAVKVAVHRLRQRYRQTLRAEIAQTVATSAEVDAELRYLFSALS